MSLEGTTAGFADLLLSGAAVVDPARGLGADSVAVAGDRILAVGRGGELGRLVGPQTRTLSCRGCSLLPGLIDGHAHMDREGLKTLLPSLAGARSIDDVLAVIADEVRRRRPGEWVVTMPIGTPPLYLDGADGLREGRWPTRHDLDRVAPDNPASQAVLRRLGFRADPSGTHPQGPQRHLLELGDHHA